MEEVKNEMSVREWIKVEISPLLLAVFCSIVAIDAKQIYALSAISFCGGVFIYLLNYAVPKEERTSGPFEVLVVAMTFSISLFTIYKICMFLDPPHKVLYKRK